MYIYAHCLPKDVLINTVIHKLNQIRVKGFGPKKYIVLLGFGQII